MGRHHGTERYVIGLDDVGRADVALVGGKAAALGELSRIAGVRVPAGCCVTTGALQRTVAAAPEIRALHERLGPARADDPETVRALGADIRRMLESVAVPLDVGAAVERAIERFGEDATFAVRSSAPGEDSAATSFAGQHETSLNVPPADVLRAVRRCWSSLFTDQALTYRLRKGLPVAADMAVVVQRMVVADGSGILFTADPVTGNRRVSYVEATFGLGEPLVSGRASGDVFKVDGDVVVSTTVASKPFEVLPSRGGGTQQRAIGPERRERPTLSQAQVLRLARLGRRIEAHFGWPQDIEWCLTADGFQIVQSRPITTLFPVPEVGDGANHVYLSVGHQQMMTDAMTPLGLSVWQLTAGRPMLEAGGRLFVDVTDALASRAGRDGLLAMAGRNDPLTGDALRTVIGRDYVPLVDDERAGPPTAGGAATIEPGPEIVARLIEEAEAATIACDRDIRRHSGVALFDFIADDIEQLKRMLFDPQSHRALMAGFDAAWWLNERLDEWLGEKNAADVLSQSVAHNVTSEMGLALLDVADVIRARPEVVVTLEHLGRGYLWEALSHCEGGEAARAAIEGWLARYGMRCTGEIDITRPRWSERPEVLVPAILGNVRNFEPGERRRRVERGRQEAQAKQRELLSRLRALPGGEEKAGETERMIERLRTFSGYREYPKYAMVSRYFVYKRALQREAAALVRGGVLAGADDSFYLRFDELREAVRTARVDEGLIGRRKAAFRSHQALRPPRVLTSDGEAVSGAYRRGDEPTGAFVGLPVCAGSVEGRARVILDIADAALEPGDILVTTYTDPSWTPLFLAVSGLVTEVGGLMTHGAVIAREYGLPAVVGVEGATRLIRDGQRIRVNGTDGYVEALAD